MELARWLGLRLQATEAIRNILDPRCEQKWWAEMLWNVQGDRAIAVAIVAKNVSVGKYFGHFLVPCYGGELDRRSLRLWPGCLAIPTVH